MDYLQLVLLKDISKNERKYYKISLLIFMIIMLGIEQVIGILLIIVDSREVWLGHWQHALRPWIRDITLRLKLNRLYFSNYLFLLLDE